MLGNLKNPPEPFGDIIRTHFRLKAQSISTQMAHWLSQDDGLQTLCDGASQELSKRRSGNRLAADIKELMLALNWLRDTEANRG